MATFFISPNGNGDGDSKNPASIYKIPELINHVNTGMTSDINILFIDGCYRLKWPVTIRDEHSGRNGFNIRLRNVPGDRPFLSGAREITGWELHDKAKNIWKATLPEQIDFQHLWFKGRRLVRARSDWNPAGFRNTSRGLKFSHKAPDIRLWKNREDIVITKRFMWRNIPATIQKIKGNEIILDPEVLKTYKVPYTALGVMEPFGLYGLLNFLAIRAARFYIENAYELISDEGDWYLDKKAAAVYFKPFDNIPFSEKSCLTYPALKTFFKLDGTTDSPVKNISIEGLSFEYSSGTKMGVTAGSPTEPTKAVAPVPENAIQINAGHNITIRDNTFLHMGCDALNFDLQGKNIKIAGNGFGDISRAAISLSQTNLVISNKSKKGVLPENRDKFFDGIEIINNYIRKTGTDDISAAVTYSEFTRNLTFTHNEIRDVPIQAIRTSWRYLGWRGHAGNIEYSWNKTSDVGQAGLEDFGALYISCSNEGYTKIHHNFVDGVGVNSNNAGIYLDVFVDKAEIFNNVSINMPGRTLNLLSRAWVAIVMSTGTRVWNNWSDNLTYKDFDQGRYRFLWPHKSNMVFENHKFKNTDKLSEEAREVIEKSGLEPEFIHIKKRVVDLIESFMQV